MKFLDAIRAAKRLKKEFKNQRVRLYLSTMKIGVY